MKRSRLHITFSLMLLLIGFSATARPRASQAQTPAATPSATAAPVSGYSGGPGALPACGQPGPSNSVPPPHPYRPGDPACDARGLGVPHPEITFHPNTPQRHAPGEQPAVPISSSPGQPAKFQSSTAAAPNYPGYPTQYSMGAVTSKATCWGYTLRGRSPSPSFIPVTLGIPFTPRCIWV